MDKFLHDSFFKQIYSHERYSLDIFRLTLTKEEFDLFDWKSIVSQATVFLDRDFNERRMDLVFGVKLKKKNTSVKIVFLLEHKSGPAPDLFQKLLEYQSCHYSREKNPVIPIVVYHGRSRFWNGHINFQDSLGGMRGDIKKHFSENVLNFKCRFLNIRDVGSWEEKTLTTWPVFYIMANIWQVNKKVIVDLIHHFQKSSKRDRKKLQDLSMDYIRRYNKRSFTWEVLEEIERKTLQKGDRIMPPLKYSLEIEREEGRQEGLLEGLQKTALAMLREHADIRMIQRCTGLTRKKIKELGEKLNEE